MLHKVIGHKTNTLAVDQLLRVLSDVQMNGTLYIGYPILATFDETVIIDALLTTLETGVVAFHFCSQHDILEDTENIRQIQDDIYTAIEQSLKKHKSVRVGRRLPFEITIITILPGKVEVISKDQDLIIVSADRLLDTLDSLKPITIELLRNINAAIQRVTTIKPIQKRTSVKKENSRGAILKKVEAEIANLDAWQKAGAIEYPEGVQSLRGLAGSGKTIVLALKAAYLHALNPDWNIVITFQTRSLYQQFKDLVRRFSYEHIGDEPNWKKLQIIHGWGSVHQPGVYSMIAIEHGIEPRDFSYGRNLFGYDSAFEGVCSELLSDIPQQEYELLFDAILIDEAQDFPQPFFELVYNSTKYPKRIIYAYDELQNLGAFSMAPPSVLFGKDTSGKPRVDELRNEDGKPKQDIVLPICYRNTPWALTVAHALGFGIYRNQGIVQFFDDIGLFDDIGYEVLAGKLELGHKVLLARQKDAYPEYFAEYIEAKDAICYRVFPDKDMQFETVAEEIYRNLTDDELEMGDILVILANPLTARSESAAMIKALAEYDIPAHLAGVTSSRDQLFSDEAIAISGIYRAKGNEAPMVYLLNSEYGYGGFELEKKRSILFTAITRSKAWARVYGCGEEMEALCREIDRVVENRYQLNFTVPTKSQMDHMRRIHRDRSLREKKQFQEIERNLSKFIDLINKGEIDFNMLPLEIRRQLEEMITAEVGE